MSSSPRGQFGAATRAVTSAKQITILDLPRNIRDCIYRYVLHGDLPIKPDWDPSVAPYVPQQNFGLLYASRQIYEEASAMLYATVDVGSNAITAWKYLDFIGEARIQQIQNLSLHYYCQGRCRSSQLYDIDSLNWMPVFELLHFSGAGIRLVDVHFWPCMSSYRSENYLETECRLAWDAEID